MNKANKIHFIGIGGIGVSALAKYYLMKGWEVSGSDLVSSEITKALRKFGAKISIGPHKSSNLKSPAFAKLRPSPTFVGFGRRRSTGKQRSRLKLKTQSLPSVVVYTPAIQSDNPELREARKYKIKCLSYPEALGELTKKYFTIAVSGTHGKSTTSAIIGLLLTKAGLNPTVIVGTKLEEFGDSNFRMGGFPKSKVLNLKSEILVIEADEHFASFLNYWPQIIVLTRIEADHLDYFKNLKDYVLAFKKFISHLSENGVLVANKDDENIKKIPPTKNSTFSKAVKNTKWYSMKQKEAKKLRKILRIPGEHNVYNALAALEVARALKIPDKTSFKALSEYRGSWRRFEIKHTELREREHKTTRKIIIVSDYAHHPTEVRVTLKAAREKFPKKEIWCVFQPHQYQRTYYLFQDFVKMFRVAPIDRLIITDIYDVAGREKKGIRKKVNSKKLVKALKKTWAIYLPKRKVIAFLKKNLRGGEVILIMGAGDIYDLVGILTKMRKNNKIKY